MKKILRSGAVAAAFGVGLSLVVLPTGSANAAAGNRVPCNDIPALKAAITFANTHPNTGITLASHCTYTLTAPDNTDDGLPEITGDVTITGRDTTIRRAPNATQDFRIFHVVSGGNLTLNSLTVSGGRFVSGSGGGVANDRGTLNLNRTVIKSNRANSGGGLASSGRLNVRSSTIERNTADGFGGGIYNEGGGTLTMIGGALLKNRASTDNGGGLENIAGAASLNHVSVKGNTAIRGGGIRQTSGATLRLESSTVSDNIAVSGAGISNLGTAATLVRSLVTHNTAITMGGGIDNQTPSQVTLTASRVIRNTPDNCTPAGSVPGCTNPAGTIAPPSSQVPPPAQSTGGHKRVS